MSITKWFKQANEIPVGKCINCFLTKVLPEQREVMRIANFQQFYKDQHEHVHTVIYREWLTKRKCLLISNLSYMGRRSLTENRNVFQFTLLQLAGRTMPRRAAQSDLIVSPTRIKKIGPGSFCVSGPILGTVYPATSKTLTFRETSFCGLKIWLLDCAFS